MSQTPWLTVITVVKDDHEGLARTYSSLAGADNNGVEFLVIDSSTDHAEVGRTLKQSGLQVQLHWTAPEGIYSAMNQGLTLANGTFVYFLNAGDELAPRALTRLRSHLLSTDTQWAFGPVEVVGTDGTVIVTENINFQEERNYCFARGRFPAHQGTIVRTEALQALGGFDTSYTIAADYHVFLKLTEVAEPTVLPDVVARFHEGGASSRQWLRSLREFHRARRQVIHPAGLSAVRERFETTRQFGAMAAHRSPWPLSLALGLLGLVVMGLTGVSVATAALLTLAVGLQALAGAVIWRLLRPRRSVPIMEAIGVGLGLGTALAMLTGLFLTWWVAPILGMALWVTYRRFRGPVAPIAPLQRPDLLALLIGLLPGLGALLLAIRNYPLSWSGLWTGYHGDMAFFEAISASAARLGPGASIFVDGAELRYHGLAYAWAGELTVFADAAPFVVLTRLVPIVMLVAAIAIVAAWTRSLSKLWWTPALAVGLVVTGGFVGATYGGVLNFDSPSQTVSTIWLLVLSLVLLQGLRPSDFGKHALVFAALVVAVTGSKVSTAAVAATGLGFVVFVGLVKRTPWKWRAVGFGLVGLAAGGSTYLWLLSGSANAGGLGLFSLLDRASSVQGLNPVITPRGVLAGIALLILAVLPRWAGLAWLLGDRRSRWQPHTLYGTGLAIGGVGALLILSGGFNDLWFAIAASAPLAVLSAVGVGSAVQFLGPIATKRVVLAAASGLLTSLIVALIWTTGTTGIIGNGWRWIGPLLGVLVGGLVGFVISRGHANHQMVAAGAYAIIALVMMSLPARVVYAALEPFAQEYEGSRSSVVFTNEGDFVELRDQDTSAGWFGSQNEAGEWLRTHAAPDDLIATNLTRDALVPALSRLTTYASNLRLQTPYGRQDQVDLALQREQESWEFIDSPSASSAEPLCNAGVEWLWIDPRKTEARDWSPFATIVWESPEALILEFDLSAC